MRFSVLRCSLVRGIFHTAFLNLLLVFIPALMFFSPPKAMGGNGLPDAGKHAGSISQIDIQPGGLLQGDYRYFAENKRADNRFDIRRARLMIAGQLGGLGDFEFEYEMQDNAPANLLDAYLAADLGPHSLVAGQFKVPFSLQWQTRNHNLYFAERSMGEYLGPGRDIGVMVNGPIFQETLYYAAGLFNGNGIGNSINRKVHDDPEIAVRMVWQPLRHTDTFLHSLSVGASGTYARIDTPNIGLKVRTTGMVIGNRRIFDLSHNTKFGVIESVDRRDRWGLEAAWTAGPLGVAGEYIAMHYRDIVAVGEKPRDAKFSSAYASLVYAVTGEAIRIENGRYQAFVPDQPFNPGGGTYGGLCIAARYSCFDGDPDWINPEAHVSVSNAEAYSIAVNWVLSKNLRLLLDFTHTNLSDPIRVRVLPDGRVDYITEEDVATLRFSLCL